MGRRAFLRFFLGPVVAAGLVIGSVAAEPLIAAANDTSGGSASQTTPPDDPGDAETTLPAAGDTETQPAAGDTQTPSADESPASGETSGVPAPSIASAAPSGAASEETTPPSTPPPPPDSAITVGPKSPSTTTSGTRAVTWSLTPAQPGLTFWCRLDRRPLPSSATVNGVESQCGTTTATTATSSPGHKTYTGLRFGRYTLTVTAKASDQSVVATSHPYSWQVGRLYSPAHYGVRTAATFNNPYGRLGAQRANLTRVIRTINSMPGYQVKSPSVMCDGAHVPSEIRITLYSASDMAFARALVAASQRCVSVQVLMNGHLTPKTTPSVRLLEKRLGNRVFTSSGAPHRSFSHRCHAGCRGGGVLHAKMYLFDSHVTAPSGPTIKASVMVGSSNMTSNASKVQWNDLYGVAKRPTLYADFLSVFNRMKRDHDQHRTLAYRDGSYSAVFTPITPHTADPSMSALRSIHCVGATSGSAGHTVVYINMHAWFEARGYALAHRVRSMSAHGCQVNILYSFMSKTVYKILRGAPRMSLRRTIFAKADGIHAKHYTHMKMLAANGYVGSNRGARVVWTGSNNYTNDGTHFDEVTMRIATAAAFKQYQAHYAYMRNTHSSAIYVKLLEPIGGGRAIDTHV